MTGGQEGLVRRPSHVKSKDRRDEFGYDQFAQQRHDARDEQPLRYRKNLNPSHHTVEGIRRNRERELPGDLLERREYEWHMRPDQGDQVQSRMAPPVGRSEKRPYVDEMALHMSPPALDAHRGYDYAEYEDYNDEAIRKPKHGYGYDDRIQISEQEYSERRFLADKEHGIMAKNRVPVKDRVDTQPVRLHQDRGHGQTSRQSSQSYSTMEMQRSKEPDCGHGQCHVQSSQSYSTLEMRRSKQENDRYQEVMSPEKLHMEKYYKDKEKHLHQSRKFSHTLSPTIQHKDTRNQDFGNHHLSKGAPSTALGVIRDDLPGGFQDIDIHPFDGYPRKPEKLSETIGTMEYGQRQHLDPRKDCEVGYADMKCHQCDPYGCTWNEHEDYAYDNVESRGKDDAGYMSRDILYREDHVHTRADSENSYIQRPSIAKPFTQSPTKVEGSHRIYIDNGLREFDVSQKEEVPSYVDLRRAIDTSIQESDCLDSGYLPVEFARRASQDLQHNEARVFHEHEMCSYDHERYVNVARTQGGRIKSSPELVEPVDIQRLSGRENRYADEQVAYNSIVKRKYLADEEDSGFNLVSTVSHKWNTFSGRQQMGDCRPEHISLSSRALHSRFPSGHEPDLFLEAKDMMDEIHHHKHSVRHGWSDQGKWENMKEKSVKSLEPGRKYMKFHAKSESSQGYGRSHYISHRIDHHKQHYVRKRTEGILMDVVEQDGNLSDDPKGHSKYNLYEDSEGFKQSVLAAFLMYSKKLNENPPIRKLYKDQGKYGTLFCIVCGRSVSKVFRDTEGLARHAFMSHKASLRAQHLGLHKAICALMGWNSEVPGDSFTWEPQALPQPEAMAQKEDLIVWQPTVIIHNISLSNTNHKQWKVICLEALEDIVRAKSFIKSRIKICLGYPGDQSVMLVKFLGTFTGMQEAEKLHKYFADKGKGRPDFEQAISDMSKSNNPVQSSTQEEIEEESLLYGYIGVAEDLDRVDFDTKKRCQIKSKRVIQDIADAPLKTE